MIKPQKHLKVKEPLYEPIEKSFLNTVHIKVKKKTNWLLSLLC